MNGSDRPLHYVLDGHRAVPEPDLMKAGLALGKVRHVAKTPLAGGLVSTVFLVTDHAFSGPPELFETVVFGIPGVGDLQQRYSTWEEAEVGHEATVAKVKRMLASRHGNPPTEES